MGAGIGIQIYNFLERIDIMIISPICKFCGCQMYDRKISNKLEDNLMERCDVCKTINIINEKELYDYVYKIPIKME